jgi:hypothetical protein
VTYEELLAAKFEVTQALRMLPRWPFEMFSNLVGEAGAGDGVFLPTIDEFENIRRLWCKFLAGRRIVGDCFSDYAASTAFQSAGAA